MVEKNPYKDVVRIAFRIMLAQRHEEACDPMLDLTHDAQACWIGHAILLYCIGIARQNSQGVRALDQEIDLLLEGILAERFNGMVHFMHRDGVLGRLFTSKPLYGRATLGRCGCRSPLQADAWKRMPKGKATRRLGDLCFPYGLVHSSLQCQWTDMMPQFNARTRVNRTFRRGKDVLPRPFTIGLTGAG
jgi:hypothetical protein